MIARRKPRREQEKGCEFRSASRRSGRSDEAEMDDQAPMPTPMLCMICCVIARSWWRDWCRASAYRIDQRLHSGELDRARIAAMNSTTAMIRNDVQDE